MSNERQYIRIKIWDGKTLFEENHCSIWNDSILQYVPIDVDELSVRKGMLHVKFTDNSGYQCEFICDMKYKDEFSTIDRVIL